MVVFMFHMSLHVHPHTIQCQGTLNNTMASLHGVGDLGSSRGTISSVETLANRRRQYEEGHRRSIPFRHQREGEDGHNSDCEVR